MMQNMATKGPTLTQKYKQLAETLEAVENDRQLLAESFGNAVALLNQDDIGWALPGSDGTYRGLRLHEVQRWSGDIRASLTGTFQHAPNPHMRNGLMLRHSFIWDGGMHYAGVPGDEQKGLKPTRGKVNVHEIMQDLDNQRLIFGNNARRRREQALFSDGLYLVVGDRKGSSVKLRPVPIHEITDTMRHPLYQDEIIAYRWTRNEAIKSPDGKYTGDRWQKSYWIYTDWYEGEIPAYVNYQSGDTNTGWGYVNTSVLEPVLRDSVAFDFHANRPDGAAFGSPDAIAALVWARIIRDLIMNGVKMQDALAMFAFKVQSPTAAGQRAQALELGKATVAGSAATMGGENDLTPLNSAGKGYDFASIGFVVATMAASLHVSGIALSANTALAGSSYGAAKTLDLPGRMAMEVRRKEHIEFDERILRWLGAPDATAYFDNYDDSTDEYRSVQAAMLAWTTGTLSPQGFRDELEIIYGRKLSGDIPPGAINPNTETLADKKAAAAAAKVTKADQGQYTGAAPAGAPGAPSAPAAKQAAAPGQGKSTGAGAAGHSSDMPVKVK